MPSASLKSAVRQIALVDPRDPKKVQSATSRLAAALDAEVVKHAKAEVTRQIKEQRLIEGSRKSPVRRSDRRAGGGVGAAVRAGENFRDRTWASDEMLSSDEAAARVNMSREALNQQRRAGKVLGLEAAKRGVRYPKWQFEDQVRPSVAAILSSLSHLDPWGHYLFFTKNEPLLGGAAPLHALRRGRAAEVLRVANLLASEARGD